MAMLIVDNKWSIEYDPENNDSPMFWYLHGEKHSKFRESNLATAMFYRLLELTTSVDPNRPKSSDIDEFEAAVRAHAFIGASSPEVRAEIEARYQAARAKFRGGS